MEPTFGTLYSMGLRLGEGLRLQVGDIDSINQRVHIRNATKSRLHEERGIKIALCLYLRIHYIH